MGAVVRASGEVKRISVENGILTDDILRQGGQYVHSPVLHVGIIGRRRRHVEQTVSETAHLDFAYPFAVRAKDGFFGLELLVHDETELRVGDEQRVAVSKVYAQDAGEDA